jgi:hypothetical protein
VRCSCDHFFFDGIVVCARIVCFGCWDCWVLDEVRQRDVGRAVILGEVVLEDLQKCYHFSQIVILLRFVWVVVHLFVVNEVCHRTDAQKRNVGGCDCAGGAFLVTEIVGGEFEIFLCTCGDVSTRVSDLLGLSGNISVWVVDKSSWVSDSLT